MSGIVGIYNLDGRPVDPLVLQRMTAGIAHRGPDGINYWSKGSVGFAHCMFRTTPESFHERQPLVDQTGALCLTMDGRIDNREELKITLASKGLRPSEDTDAELVLRSYEIWGDRVPEHLTGDFSFAVWDGRLHRLVCGRDRLGVKPFCYALLPGRLFAFASEIRSLLTLPGISLELNEWMIVELFEPAFEGFDSTATFFKNLFKLEPATTLTVLSDRKLVRRYWSLDTSRELHFNSDDEYVDCFREHLKNAVRSRMRGQTHVGVLLSGGVDSGSILAAASRIAEQTDTQIHALSGVAEDNCPESTFIQSVLKRIPVCSHVIHSGEADQYVEDYEQAILQASEPVEPTRNYLPRILYRIAARNGLRVVMDGVDGDLATCHGFTIPYLLRAGRWFDAISQCKEVADKRRSSTFQVFRSVGIRPLAPRAALWVWDKIRRNEISSKHLFNKRFSSRINLARRMKFLHEQSFTISRSPAEDHASSVTCGILPFSFEQYDLTAAAIPVEARHPFSDHRLIEFCVAIPPRLKYSCGYTKFLLRRAADPDLPDEVRWRVERPTVGPRFMSALFASKRQLFDHAFSHFDLINEYLNVSALQRIRRRYDRTNNPFALDFYLILSAAYLVLWLLQFKSRHLVAIESNNKSGRML
jgi:asparagine synthase (glutamine-hydrolysing)